MYVGIGVKHLAGPIRRDVSIQSSRSFRVLLDNSPSRSSRNIYLDDILKVDVLTRLFTQKVGRALNLRHGDAHKRAVHDAYMALSATDQTVVQRWLQGDAGKAIEAFAKNSPPEAPFVVDPSRFFEPKGGSMKDYETFQTVFEKLPVSQQFMIREIKDSRFDLVAAIEKVSYGINYIKSFVRNDEKPTMQRMSAYNPNAFVPSFEKGMATAEKVYLPMSSCTIRDDYQHLSGSKVQLVIFGEGWPLQKVAFENRVIFDVDFSVQDEVVNKEGEYTVVSVFSFPEDLVVVLEKSPGDIAKALGEGDSVEDSHNCMQRYFDSIFALPDSEKRMSFTCVTKANMMQR